MEAINLILTVWIAKFARFAQKETVINSITEPELKQFAEILKANFNDVEIELLTDLLK